VLILFLLAIPIVVIGLLVWLVVRSASASKTDNHGLEAPR